MTGVQTCALPISSAAGFAGIKLNAVIRRGLNDGDIVGLAEYAREGGHTLRLIEYMDVGSSNGWRLDEVVPASEIVAQVRARYPLEPLPPSRPGEVANRYRYLDGGGEIGIIAAVSAPFCGDCTRARISAEGRLYTCLFASEGSDLKRHLRPAPDTAALRETLRARWTAREDRYSELRDAETAHRVPKVEMFRVGG